jgi:hypothetical protein
VDSNLMSPFFSRKTRSKTAAGVSAKPRCGKRMAFCE